MRKKNLILFFVLIFIFSIFLFMHFITNQSFNMLFNNKIKGIDITSNSMDKDNGDNFIVLDEKKDDVDLFQNKVYNMAKKTPNNILVVGVDIPDIDKVAHKAKMNKTGTGVRTDTIMLIQVDHLADKVYVTSIPRDSRVYINGKLDKINHAHSYQGIDLTQKVVEETFDIKIDRYIRVDYRAVKEFVNDIGGVEVEINEPMVYKDPTPDVGVDINFKPGKHLLNGDDAIRYLRYRSSEGDIYRVKNQQYFIQQVIAKILGFNLFEMAKIIFSNSIKYVDTDLSLGEMYGFVKMAERIDFNDILFNIVPGKGKYINGIAYYIIDQNFQLNTF